MRDADFASNPALGATPGSPTPPAYGQDYDPVSLGSAVDPAVVQLGDLADGDSFLPPLGNFSKKKRPATWRPGYSPRSGVLSIFPSLMRRRMSSASKDGKRYLLIVTGLHRFIRLFR